MWTRRYKYRVYEMELNTRAHKDRPARSGREGRQATALEGEPVVEAELVVIEGDAEAAGGADEVVNGEDTELDEDVVSLDEVVEGVGIGGSDVSTLPTVIVVGIMLPLWKIEEGMEKVVVAEARGEEKSPDIPLRVKKGENAK